MSTNVPILSKFEDLSYFDNLALYYLCNETPPKTLSLAFLKGDPKVVGPMLGVIDPKRREYIHKLMAENNNKSEEEKDAAVSGMLLIGDNIINRNLIRKEGKYFFGVNKSE